MPSAVILAALALRLLHGLFNNTATANLVPMASDVNVDPVTVLINSGGIIAGIGICLWFFMNRKVHTHGEFMDVVGQRDTIAKDYADLQSLIIKQALPQTLDANRLALEQLPERTVPTKDAIEDEVARRVAAQMQAFLSRMQGGGGSRGG